MRRCTAFTLVELLTVIALVAILAAILFPVLSTVREKARQASCMSNLKTITQAVNQFHLDRRRYPEHLFGPAVCPDGTIPPEPPPPNHVNSTMETVAQLIRNKDRTERGITLRRLYQHSLWPEYLRDLSVYHCPNNTTFARAELDSGTTVVQKPTLWKAIASRTAPSWTPLTLYRYDSYDCSPAIDPHTGRLDLEKPFVVRYSRHWFPYSGTEAPADVDAEHYRRQLIWRNPDDDTYLTLCAYHADKTGMVPVAFLSGTVKVVPLASLSNSLLDPGDRYRIPLPNKDFRFWELRP